MKTKRLSAIFSATVLGVSSLLTVGIMPLAGATSGSDTCTWTGATDNNWSTAGNWSNCSSAAPVNGDNLVFDATNLSSLKTLSNDITGLTLGNITFQGGNSSYSGYSIGGNALSISGGININSSASNTITANLTLTGDIIIGGNNTGSMNLDGNTNLAGHTLTTNKQVNLDGTLSGGGTVALSSGALFETVGNNSSWAGQITAASGATILAVDANSLGSAAATITVASGAELDFQSPGGANITQNITVAGNGLVGDSVQAAIQSYVAGQGSSADITFSGTVTLTANTVISSGGTMTFSGPLRGSYTLTAINGMQGTLIINSNDNQSQSSNSTSVNQAQTVTVAVGDNQPSQSVEVGRSVTEVLDGQRGYVSVQSGGTLKGTGQASSVYVFNGGTVAPGHSPGKLTITNILTLGNGAAYQAELKDKNDGDFDQLVVGAATDTDNNNPDVTLGDTNGSPTLQVSLYDGYKISKGDQFMIINNLSKTDVKGTFANLPEGATFKVGNAVFAITYKGGDGNDVVLTAQNTPATPDTGFGMVAAHPGATLGLTVVAAGAILMIARRTRLAPAHGRTATRRRK